MSTPGTEAGRRLLGKNASSDHDQAWVDWLANDIAAIEAEAVATIREAIETEWYNGNIDQGAYERLDAIIGKPTLGLDKS